MLVLVFAPVGLWLLLRGKLMLLFSPWFALIGVVVVATLAFPGYYLAERATPGFLEYFLWGEHILRYVESDWSGDRYGAVKDRPFGTIWLFLLFCSFPWVLVLLNRKTRNRLLRRDHFTDFLLMCAFLPAIFFTFARNVISTYVLPSLVPLAILLCARTMFGLRMYVITAGAGLAVFLLIVVGALQFYLLPHSHNQKPILQAYWESAREHPGRLIYNGGVRHTVLFYTEGRTRQFNELLKTFYESTETTYFVMSPLWPRSRQVVTEACTVLRESHGVRLIRCSADQLPANAIDS